ncbi:MAG: helix-turn-helix domain-containing protein [Clostridiales bacterium]|nr:helix-turn-helix domain-containing protein [Clostridiales bacterium]
MYENLKKLRESLKMTQADFGNSVGVAKSTYNNYETGIREPKSDFWISVASTYGVTIDYLMGFSDDPRDGETKKASPRPDEADLLRNYQKLNEDGKEYIRQQMAIALQVYGGEYDNASDLEAAK